MSASTVDFKANFSQKLLENKAFRHRDWNVFHTGATVKQEVLSQGGGESRLTRSPGTKVWHTSCNPQATAPTRMLLIADFVIRCCLLSTAANMWVQGRSPGKRAAGRAARRQASAAAAASERPPSASAGGFWPTISDAEREALNGSDYGGMDLDGAAYGSRVSTVFGQFGCVTAA